MPFGLSLSKRHAGRSSGSGRTDFKHFRAESISGLRVRCIYYTAPPSYPTKVIVSNNFNKCDGTPKDQCPETRQKGEKLMDKRDPANRQP